MADDGYVLIGEEQKPNIVEFKHWKDTFGRAEELTSAVLGARQANISRITLTGRDILHYHKVAEETYVCREGEGYLFLNGKIVRFSRGDIVVIHPGTVHAAMPTRRDTKLELVFWCVSSPPFDPKDVFNDPRGRRWATGMEPSLSKEIDGILADDNFVLMEFAQDRQTFPAAEFTGSMEFENILAAEKVLDLLNLAREAAGMNSELTGATNEQRDAYQTVRAKFFTKKLTAGDPGWQEWNTVVHRQFQEVMNTFPWPAIAEARKPLKRFLDNPADASEEEIGDLRKFFTRLATML